MVVGGIVKGTKLVAVLLGFLVVVTISGGAWAQSAPQGPMILKGAPMGAVKFDHTTHVKVAGKCDVCHHASKPEKPLKSPQEACTDCHTKPPTPPVTTSLQAAFHNPAATAGLCIDCHKKQNAAGKATPVKCAECHQKANG
jgi:Class III cytochrome C family